MAFRNDGITPISGRSANVGEQIIFQMSVIYAPFDPISRKTNASFEGGSMSLIVGGAAQNVTPSSGIPVLGPAQCNGVNSFKSTTLPYTVTSADAGAGRVFVEAVYNGGTAHIGADIPNVVSGSQAYEVKVGIGMPSSAAGAAKSVIGTDTTNAGPGPIVRSQDGTSSSTGLVDDARHPVSAAPDTDKFEPPSRRGLTTSADAIVGSITVSGLGAAIFLVFCVLARGASPRIWQLLAAFALLGLATFLLMLPSRQPPKGTQPLIVLGVLALGGFVGLVLSLGLHQSRPRLRAAITVLGAALGGAPVAFLKGLGTEKWAYPIGLLLGFLWHHVGAAREVLVSAKYARDTPHHRRRRLFAWSDIVFILIVTVATCIYLVWTRNG